MRIERVMPTSNEQSNILPQTPIIIKRIKQTKWNKLNIRIIIRSTRNEHWINKSIIFPFERIK